MSPRSEPAAEPESAAQPGASAALFRPVRTRNAFEETVERLLQAIRLGVTRPGERLPAERELAGLLGVSRVTLREALRAVADAGYVESRRGRYGGTFVAADLPGTGSPATEEPVPDVEDVLTLRRVLESGAAEAAATRPLTQDQRRELRGRLTEVADADSQDEAEYRRLDSRLHLAIAELTGSPSLTTAVADVRSTVNGLLDAIPWLPANIEHSNAQHAEIVEAILSGDQAAARAAMEEHLEGTESLLRAFLT
ncbi:FadR/GntR family transcriptional regulator [Microlunatus speluncae]|uniref:FadR/GntR family transcriptional regulator n=1 Tax=Microlunatus speluncae TaxID=2594267 RepID=UPI0012667504|nr:FCD domain-containing protein [Microlunatus speluncae]